MEQMLMLFKTDCMLKTTSVIANLFFVSLCEAEPESTTRLHQFASFGHHDRVAFQNYYFK